MVIVRNGSVCLSVLLLWFCHLPLNMPDEMNQREQPHSLRVRCMRALSEYKIKDTIVLGNPRESAALWCKGQQTSTLTLRTHMQNYRQKTDIRNKGSEKLPTSHQRRAWVLRTFVLEAWRWHGHNNYSQQKIFFWVRGGKKKGNRVASHEGHNENTCELRKP